MKKILIVDDSDDMLQIYKTMFEGREDMYHVETLSDARLAYKRLKEGGFDMMILDIIMDPMPGDMFYACVRDDEKVKDIPILAISVLSPGDLEYLRKFNHIEFLQKPVTEEELFGKIQKILE